MTSSDFITFWECLMEERSPIKVYHAGLALADESKPIQALLDELKVRTEDIPYLFLLYLLDQFTQERIEASGNVSKIRMLSKMLQIGLVKNGKKWCQIKTSFLRLYLNAGHGFQYVG